MLQKVKFSDCVKYMIKGPFGSDMKKSLYVPKGEDTYKVYIQGNAIQKDEALGEYYVSKEYFHSKLERFEVHPGDYIITCDGTLGKYLKLGDNIEKGVISSSLLLLKLDEEKIYDKYFELLWEYSMLGYLASQARNACLIHLPSAKAIGDVGIELPSMELQKDIANKAYSIKAICDNREEEISLLDQLIKARFVELFGNPVTNDKGWSTDSCKNLMKKIGSGATPKGGRESYCDEGISLIRSMNVYNNRFEYKDLAHITDEQAEQLDNVTIEKSDVLLNITGASVARCCVVPDDLLPARVNQHVSIIRCKERLLPEFVCSLFTENNYQRLLWNIATAGGATREAITKQQIEDLQLIVPPLDLQKQFMEFVKQVDKSKFVVSKTYIR